MLEIQLTTKLEHIGLILDTIFAGICIDPNIVGTEAYIGINIPVEINEVFNFDVDSLQTLLMSSGR